MPVAVPDLDRSAPERYELLLPDGWWSVDLHPDRRAASVDALVAHQWRGVDDAPHLRVQARDALLEQAERAADAGGLQLLLSVGDVAGLPLSASLLVSRVPLASSDELDALAQERRDRGVDVEQVELPAGPALRSRWQQDPEPDDPSGLPTTCLDLHVRVPGAAAVLLLSFRTPLAPLAEALVDLFDAVALTLRWTGAERSRAAGYAPHSPARSAATRGDRRG